MKSSLEQVLDMIDCLLEAHCAANSSSDQTALRQKMAEMKKNLLSPATSK